MNLNPAEFLNRYGALFTYPVVASWVWEGDDDIFGKTCEWSLIAADGGAHATVDLTEAQLQLTITERNQDNESVIVFSALVSFEEASITLDGGRLLFDDSAVRQVIEQFNERS